jgi:hypothetical protein
VQRLRHAHIGHRAVGEHAEAWQVAVVVQHQMQFDRSFGALVLGPVENIDRLKSMTVESMLTSLFLKRNLRRPPPTVAETFSYRPWKTASNSCHGRWALA